MPAQAQVVHLVLMPERRFTQPREDLVAWRFGAQFIHDAPGFGSCELSIYSRCLFGRQAERFNERDSVLPYVAHMAIPQKRYRESDHYGGEQRGPHNALGCRT